jgi:hypothetical protein
MSEVVMVTNADTIHRYDTIGKASRDAHRWLRRRVAATGEWATILDPATGETLKRYMLRNGRVERMS